MLIRNNPELYAKLVDSILKNQLLGDVETREAMVGYIGNISKIEERVAEVYEYNLREAHRVIEDLKNQLMKLETAYTMNDDMILRMVERSDIEPRFVLETIVAGAQIRKKAYERNPVKVTLNQKSIPETKYAGKTLEYIQHEMMMEARERANIIYEQLNDMSSDVSSDDNKIHVSFKIERP